MIKYIQWKRFVLKQVKAKAGNSSGVLTVLFDGDEA
jgi:hypothetical protein